MSHPIIEERLKSYNVKSIVEEENALKEILQEIALYALSKTDFFSKAIFQGGTALRILYGLPRFSEDLDFILKTPDKKFRWQDYAEQITKAFELFSLTPEITDRSKADTAVQKLFLKDNSIGKLLTLQFQHHAHRKLMIKFEIDTNPPIGSLAETKFLAFPTNYAIQAQDLPSNFAGKCHALLCREYVKGRDWFDLIWYAARGTPINYFFLQSAMEQDAHWAKQLTPVTGLWLRDELIKKADSLNWAQVKNDVLPFVNLPEQESLDLWSVDFFIAKIEQVTRPAILVKSLGGLYETMANEKNNFLKAWQKFHLKEAIKAYKTKWFDLCASSVEKGHAHENEISREPKYLGWLTEAEKIDEHLLVEALEQLKKETFI